MKDNGAEDTMDDLYNDLRHGILEKSKYHSLNCYLQFVSTSTRYWELLMDSKFEDLLVDAQTTWEKLTTARTDMISHSSDDSRYNWETPAEGELSEENLAKYQQDHDDIVEFLQNILSADDSLYDNTFKSAKRRGMANDMKRKALAVSFWAYRMGVDAQAYHHQDKTW